MTSHRATGPAVAKAEPVITVATVSALVSAIIMLLVSFGVDIPEGVEKAILAVIVAAAPIVAGIVARRYVTPNTRVIEREDHGAVVAGKGHETITEGKPIREAGAHALAKNLRSSQRDDG